MPSTILVTGAAGFAGSHLLDLLASEQASVVAWHRPGRTPPAAPPPVRWEAIDLLDRAAVRQAIERVQPAAVYHCAAAELIGPTLAPAATPLAVNARATNH